MSSVHIEVGDLQSHTYSARKVSLDYRFYAHADSKPQLSVQGQFRAASNQQWSDASLTCASFDQTIGIAKNNVDAQVTAKSKQRAQKQQWQCEKGRLVATNINAPFSLKLEIANTGGLQQISTVLDVQQANLSDAAGLHAGEKISATFTGSASQERDQWRWQADVDWRSGEAFWQPFYFASGGHHFAANGRVDSQSLKLDSAELSVKDVGVAKLSGELRLADHQLQSFKLTAPDLNLEAMYPLLLKPLLDKTTLNNLEIAGSASITLDMEQGSLRAFMLDMDNVDVEDKEHRFAIYKLNGHIPWQRDGITNASLAYAGGSLLKVPLGATQLQAELNRYALSVPELTLPILDGALHVSDVSAAWVNDAWHWHLKANVVPIDMVELSQALSLPRMEGKVAASIPLVTYSNGQLSVDGEMGFNLFDGSIVVRHLAMQTPLGKASRLTADMQMQNLDLGALTRTFAFGAIEGKLDGAVSNLQLVNWKPVYFDADFHSSNGRYPKKISQRAVENISALGGAGAAAAIQRSFLRFLKEFNYEKIGLSCRLRNDVCNMGGVEAVQATGNSVPSYIIVKGSGVPSITVMGYNHSVGWADLLERIARITAGNVAPVIK